ncbi:hypothetical protein Droror1_Dr00008494 [Drosera rotundifolia]
MFLLGQSSDGDLCGWGLPTGTLMVGGINEVAIATIGPPSCNCPNANDHPRLHSLVRGSNHWHYIFLVLDIDQLVRLNERAVRFDRPKTEKFQAIKPLLQWDQEDLVVVVVSAQEAPVGSDPAGSAQEAQAGLDREVSAQEVRAGSGLVAVGVRDGALGLEVGFGDLDRASMAADSSMGFVTCSTLACPACAAAGCCKTA